MFYFYFYFYFFFFFFWLLLSLFKSSVAELQLPSPPDIIDSVSVSPGSKGSLARSALTLTFLRCIIIAHVPCGISLSLCCLAEVVLDLLA